MAWRLGQPTIYFLAMQSNNRQRQSCYVPGKAERKTINNFPQVTQYHYLVPSPTNEELAQQAYCLQINEKRVYADTR